MDNGVIQTRIGILEKAIRLDPGNTALTHEMNELIKGRRAQVGEIRTWNGKKVQKQSDGKRKPVKEGGGASIPKGVGVKKLDRHDINVLYDKYSEDPKFEEFERKQNKIFSKYLKYDPSDYVVTGGGGSTEEEMWKELMDSPDKFFKLISELDSLNKKYGYTVDPEQDNSISFDTKLKQQGFTKMTDMDYDGFAGAGKGSFITEPEKGGLVAIYDPGLDSSYSKKGVQILLPTMADFWDISGEDADRLIGKGEFKSFLTKLGSTLESLGVNEDSHDLGHPLPKYIGKRGEKMIGEVFKDYGLSSPTI